MESSLGLKSEVQIEAMFIALDHKFIWLLVELLCFNETTGLEALNMRLQGLRGMAS